MKYEIALEDPEFIFVTEVKPKNGSPTCKELLEINGYNLHLNSSYSEDGTRGTAIYSKDYLSVTTIENEVTMEFKDSLWLELHGRSDKILLACIYRSGTPAKALALDPKLHNAIQHMSNLNCYSEVVLAGDFNHPRIKWSTVNYDFENHIIPQPPNSQCDLNFVKCLEESSLVQHVTKPTRYRYSENPDKTPDQTPTLIDLILTRHSETIEDLQYKSHLGASDHLILQFEISYDIQKPIEIRKPKLNYMKADMKKFNTLMNTDWDVKLLNKTPEEAYTVFLEVYNHAVAESIPSTFISTSTRYVKPPWMRPSTLKLVKKKHNLLIRFLNTKQKRDKEAYNRIRNQVAHQTSKDRSDYENKVAEETKQNVNAFWRYVNSNRKSKSSIPDLKKPDGSKAVTDEEKAEVLNSQFSSVFTAEDLTNLPEPHPLNLIQKLDTIEINSSDVIKKLKSLRSDKAPGPDGIHPHLLKTLAETFGPILTKIYNISLQHKQLPPTWKNATITAIFKRKGSKSEAMNYRPVSLTSVPCKVMESLVVDNIITHLIINQLKNPNQHGFTVGKSTVTNLISALNIWSESLSHGIPIDIVYLDFEKAFDKVPHARLLQQLNNYGITGTLHAWITDFLKNRFQAVRVSSSLSSSSPVLSGVPQGSVLGPVLFLIYVANISEHINNFTSLFADDTKLFSFVLEENSATSLQQDIDTLTHWAERMQMSFNLSKCHVMHLGSKNPQHLYHMYKTSHQTKKKNSISYKLVFHDLEEVGTETDLGICVDSNLTFSDHISAKLSKANKMLQIIKHTFKHITPEIFKMLYTTLVRPHLEYGTPVWSPHTARDIKRLESLQRRATKIIPSLHDKPYEERLETLQLPTLEYRRIRQDLLLMWNITSKNVCMDLHTHCTKCPDKNMLQPTLSRKTRGHCLKYQLQQHQSYRSHFFSTRTTPLWNRLKETTVTANTIHTFKAHLAKDPAMPPKYIFSKI